MNYDDVPYDWRDYVQDGSFRLAIPAHILDTDGTATEGAIEVSASTDEPEGITLTAVTQEPATNHPIWISLTSIWNCIFGLHTAATTVNRYRWIQPAWSRAEPFDNLDLHLAAEPDQFDGVCLTLRSLHNNRDVGSVLLSPDHANAAALTIFAAYTYLDHEGTHDKSDGWETTHTETLHYVTNHLIGLS